MNFTINKNIAHEIIDGEAIIVNLENGNYYSLDKSGAEVWDCIEKNLFFHDVMELITQRYEGNLSEIETSIKQILADMEKEGLITIHEEVRGEHTPPKNEIKPKDTKKPLFVPPTLQKYTDMQAMLWLDPIHDVDETGWPNTPDFLEKN